MCFKSFIQKLMQIHTNLKFKDNSKTYLVNTSNSKGSRSLQVRLNSDCDLDSDLFKP